MLVSIVNLDKPKRLIGLSQKARSRVGALIHRPTRTPRLPVYRADLNHPGNLAEHGNAVNPAQPRDWADPTARRVRAHSIGKTEEAKASGNALDRPTSVWSILARELVEPSKTKKANDGRRSLADAPRSGCPRQLC